MIACMTRAVQSDHPFDLIAMLKQHVRFKRRIGGSMKRVGPSPRL